VLQSLIYGCSSTPRRQGSGGKEILLELDHITALEEEGREETLAISPISQGVLDAETEMGYWDLEEGKDCVAKTWITTKVATAIG